MVDWDTVVLVAHSCLSLSSSPAPDRIPLLYISVDTLKVSPEFTREIYR